MLIHSTSFEIYSESFNSNLCHFCIFSLPYFRRCSVQAEGRTQFSVVLPC